MKKLTEMITDIVKDAFVQCGYSARYGLVTLSDRPDLCQLQCNGALAAAKEYRQAPIVIATEITNVLKDYPDIKEVSCVMPGFINITLKDSCIVIYKRNV